MQRCSYWTKIRSGIAVAALCLGLTAVAEAAPFGYIADSYDGWVTVIDLANDTATNKVLVGNAPIGVAVTPDGSQVYVANRGSDSVSVIEAVSNVVVATIPVGSQPQGVAVSPDGSKAFVAHYGNPALGARTYLSEINTGDYSVTKTIETSAQAIQPFAVITNPAGTRIYISNNLSDSVSIVNATTFTLASEVFVGDYPMGMAITPDGSKLLVANNGGNSVAVINTADNSVAFIAMMTGAAPWGVTINPNGLTAYVTNAYLPEQAIDAVAVINLTTNEITTSIAVGNNPRGIEINSDGTFVYAANRLSETVSVIDTALNEVVKTINLHTFSGGTLGGLEGIDLGPVPKGILSVVSSLRFSDLIVTSTSFQTVTVTNRGILDLALGSISAVNPLAAPFSLSENGCSNQILAPGATCTFKVNFAPTAVGEFSDSFDIPYLDPAAGTATASVAGYGLSANNQRPGKPALISPTDGQIGVALTPTFSWTEVTDPDGDVVNYSIVCSTSPDFTAGTLVTLHFGEQKSLYAGLGAAALALFGIGAAGNQRNRKKLALLVSLLILASALVSACGGGGGGSSTSPIGVEGTLTTPLTANTKYYWKVVADDSRDSNTSDVWSFTTKP
ncbi:MAG: hypothetical protein CVU69_09015 [Deltaproteobacteria bacterium HGW-Deltaproteobacteria-4]|nr:MAG: hypothetical protein CVU69_09015 [Deltaproteobacteria bacterium HGW-Deltaproteobacteria-4]